MLTKLGDDRSSTQRLAAFLLKLLDNKPLNPVQILTEILTEKAKF